MGCDFLVGPTPLLATFASLTYDMTAAVHSTAMQRLVSVVVTTLTVSGVLCAPTIGNVTSTL
jgi:hypothetical protein